MTDATATKQSHLIAPHGGELIDRTVSGDEASALAAEATSLPRVRMSDKQTADLDMIASGALSPLTGFMTKADYEGSVEEMHLANGLPWALPVTLSVSDTKTCVRPGVLPAMFSTCRPSASLPPPSSLLPLTVPVLHVSSQNNSRVAPELSPEASVPVLLFTIGSSLT